MQNKEKKQKFSTNHDLTQIEEIGHNDRKYTSVTDEYRRYFGVQKKCKIRYLNREEVWQFINYFFNETYGIEYNKEDKPGKKYVGKLKKSSHRKISILHWNVEGYEFSIDEQKEVLHRISLRIGKGIFGGYKLFFKHMIKSNITIGGLQGDISKFHLRYYHKQNAKEVFRSLKLLDKYKKEHRNIDGAYKFLKQKANEYQLAKNNKRKNKKLVN